VRSFLRDGKTLARTQPSEIEKHLSILLALVFVLLELAPRLWPAPALTLALFVTVIHLVVVVVALILFPGVAVAPRKAEPPRIPQLGLGNIIISSIIGLDRAPGPVLVQRYFDL
jgi:hypothetical protein